MFSQELLVPGRVLGILLMAPFNPLRCPRSKAILAPFPGRKSRCRTVNNLSKDKQRVNDLSDFNPKSVPLHRLSCRGWGQRKGVRTEKRGPSDKHAEEHRNKDQTPKGQAEGVGSEIICHPATLEEVMLPPEPRSQACPAPQSTLWWAPLVTQ